MDPGTYEAVAIRWQGPQWVRRFGRWGLFIEFELLSGVKVCCFYNLGRNREAPRIAHRGKYFKLWCMANGGKPMHGDGMSPEVFLDRTFTVEVTDTEGGHSLVSDIKGISELSTQGAKQEAVKHEEAFRQSSTFPRFEAVKPTSSQGVKEPSTQAHKQPSTDSGVDAGSASQLPPYGQYFIECLKSGQPAHPRERYEALLRAGSMA